MQEIGPALIADPASLGIANALSGEKTRHMDVLMSTKQGPLPTDQADFARYLHQAWSEPMG